MQKTLSWKSTIPANLKPGKYLIRHEAIALHGSASEGGAQFYPNCMQLLVSGDGTELPDATVNFPGAYGKRDKGIWNPKMYENRFRRLLISATKEKIRPLFLCLDHQFGLPGSSFSETKVWRELHKAIF